MKKRILLILSCILLSAAILTSVFASTGSGEAVASAPVAAPGETVEVTMYVSEFTQAVNTLSAKFTVPEGLEIVSGQWLLSGGMKNVNLTNKNGVMSTDGDAFDLSQKTAVFKLTFSVKDIEVGQTALENLVSVTIGLNYGSQKLGSVSAETVVTVQNPVTELTVDETLSLDLSANATAQLQAQYAPLNTTDKLSWKSETPDVATVNDQGVVTAVKEGEAIITVTMGQKTAQCTVRVTCGHTQVQQMEANDATCVNPGNLAYDLCLTCGDLLEAGTKTETTLEAVTIPELDHDFTEKLVDDAHFVVGSGANCQQTKKYYFDCSRCDVMDTTTTFDGEAGEHQISDRWTTENEFHFHECTVEGCDYTEDRAACGGGVATCLAKATCSDCLQPYGELAGCDFTAQKTEEDYLVTAATCKDFAVYHLSCSVCGAEGEGTFVSDILDRDNHVGGTEVRDDAEATCTTNGYTGDTYCLGCAEKVATGEVIPATAHKTATEVAEVPSTCKTNGVKAHYHCPVCNKDFLEKTVDAVAQTAEDLKLALDPENHTGKTELKNAVAATCTEAGYSGDTYCVDCGEEVKKGAAIAATGKHTPETAYQTNDKEHWKICSHCDAVLEETKKAHNLTWIVDKKATESAEGVKHQKCEDCGYICSENTVIEKLEHAPKLVKGKEATATTAGVLEHFYCSNCGKYYASENGKAGEQIRRKDTVIPALGNVTGTDWKDEAQIQEVVDAVQNAQTGETVTVDMSQQAAESGKPATFVPTQILEAAREKEATVVLDMGDYSWIINGKDVKDGKLEAIDLEVVLDTQAIPTETVDALAGDKPTKQLSLIHEGDFGFKAVLKIQVGAEYAGKLGKLYYYNANNELEYITADEIDAQGYAELAFSHASDYVVVMEEQEPAPTDPDQDGTQATQPGQDTDAPEKSVLPMILIIAAVVVIALVVILVIRKRKTQA